MVFSGLARGHGRHIPDDKENPDKGGKREGKSSFTVHDPATIELWTAHLAGTYSLGIIPIKDDGTARFGVIDVDVYDGDLPGLAAKLVELELPLTLCRSKSGGPHLYLFTKEDVPASLIRAKLMEWAVILGYSGVEVFPKQTRLAGPNDWGTFVNMPYFGGSARRAILANGVELSPEDFITVAENGALSFAELSAYSVRRGEDFDDHWEEGPPCLQTLAVRGFPAGTRNKGLFNIAVYLRKRFGEGEWEGHLDEYNQKYMEPPLGHQEVAKIVKSVNKKTYEYTSKDEPLSAVCNRQLCLTRKYGTGTGDDDPGVAFGPLIKVETDPVTWIWDVNGERIELTTAELKEQNRFTSRAMEVLNVWPNSLKPQKWAELVREKLSKVEVQEVPVEAKPEGFFWSYLQQYCIGRTRAKSRDELLNDKPWTPTEADAHLAPFPGKTYFRLEHFIAWLEQQRLRITPKQATLWLRKRGGGPHFFNLKGRGCNTWYVDAFAAQTADLDVPRLDGDEEPM
jgi:hypothetical protein